MTHHGFSVIDSCFINWLLAFAFWVLFDRDDRLHDRESSVAKTLLSAIGPTRPTESSVVAELYETIQSFARSYKSFDGGFLVFRLLNESLFMSHLYEFLPIKLQVVSQFFTCNICKIWILCIPSNRLENNILRMSHKDESLPWVRILPC